MRQLSTTMKSTILAGAVAVFAFVASCSTGAVPTTSNGTTTSTPTGSVTYNDL